jgi:hypothetical protein
MQALSKVASQQSDGSLRLPRQQLRDAISHLRLKGKSGRIEFDALGERRQDVGAALYQVRPDAVRLVSTLHR